MSANIKNESGFTLPELVVSISLIGIISVSLLSAMIYYFVNISRNAMSVDMTSSSQNLLRATVEQLRYGAGVRQSNTITDANGPGGGWNTSNANFVIIIAVPAVDSSDNYLVDTTTGAPYNNELVYFKQGTILYRRTLANPSASGNKARTSCPVGSSSSTCPPDARLMDYVNDMVFTLYDQDDAITTDPLLARSVKINLSMKRNSFGGPLTLDNTIQVTLRNTFQ